VTQIRQYAGPEGSGTYQHTSMTYDGYGRLKTKHVPEESTGTATTWTYNADDSVSTITDPRGAVSTFGYAGTNRGLVKSITHTLSGSPTINVSYNYDAVGNRTSMTDGLGTVDYSYDQLSRMASETRTLSGGANYPISYSYNLAGQLASYSVLGHSVSYTRDGVGRLTGITGFGSLTPYVSNVKYRAWGGRREITYGDNYTATIQYNSKLLPISYSMPNVITRNYGYFADGRLKTSDLAQDGNFYRTYEYDQVGRLKSENTPTNFSQVMTYDVWDNATNVDGWHWSHFIGSSGTYSNNRNTNWNYNAAGQVTSNIDTFAYDAAGRISETWTQGILGSRKSLYDGDSQVVGAAGTFSNVRSTVLGGRVVAEVSNTGQAYRTFIYGEGEDVVGFRYEGTNRVIWEHRDIAGESARQTEDTGIVVDQREETASGAKIEQADPYPSNPNFTGADTDGEYPHLGAVGKPITGCARDGIPLTDCRSIFQAMEFHNAELTEWNAAREFLGWSILVGGKIVGFFPTKQKALEDADLLGTNILVRNWRVNDNWFQTPYVSFTLVTQTTTQATPAPGSFEDCFRSSGLATTHAKGQYADGTHLNKEAANLLLDIHNAESTSLPLLAVTLMNENTSFNLRLNPMVNVDKKGNPRPEVNWDVGPFQLNQFYINDAIKRGAVSMNDLDYGGIYGMKLKANEPFYGDPLQNGRMAARHLNTVGGKTDRERAINYAAREGRGDSYDSFAPLFERFFNCYHR